ncbi:MAG: hypothetical protein G8D89_22310 [gamma proteobacterium symbiont of Clathrolucina costata]
MTEKLRGLIPVRAINFLHIYLYNVLIMAAVLGMFNITAENALFVVIGVGIISGIGITVLDEQCQMLEGRLLSVKEAAWYALIAPFQILKIRIR